MQSLGMVSSTYIFGRKRNNTDGFERCRPESPVWRRDHGGHKLEYALQKIRLGYSLSQQSAYNARRRLTEY